VCVGCVMRAERLTRFSSKRDMYLYNVFIVFLEFINGKKHALDGYTVAAKSGLWCMQKEANKKLGTYNF
jgi:hypothetical protein